MSDGDRLAYVHSLEPRTLAMLRSTKKSTFASVLVATVVALAGCDPQDAELDEFEEADETRRTPFPGIPFPGPKFRGTCWMISGDYIPPGESIPSCNGQFRLAMQTDGNLVIYNVSTGVWQPVWWTGTSSPSPAGFFVYGEVVGIVEDTAGNELWRTNAPFGDFLELGDDGRFCTQSWEGRGWCAN